MGRRARAVNRLLPVALALIVTSTGLSGCIGALHDYYSFDADAQYVNPGVFPGAYRPPGEGSGVLLPGHAITGDPEIYRLASNRPHSLIAGQPEAPAESTVYISMAAWVPTNGSASRFPVIVVAGPFFEQGRESMTSADDDPPRDLASPLPRGHSTVRWLLRNFLPLGYAVAVVGVRGTGTSGGCMELLGPREASDLDQAIRFLATQAWSNGRVAMFGIGYEGATPWLVAAQGNQFLKTIVPVSGWADTFGMLFHNGTVESRAALLPSDYWFAGFDQSNNPPPRPTEVPEPGPPVPPGTWPQPFVGNGREAYQDRQNALCDEAYRGFATAAYSTVAGDRGAATDFWAARDYRQRVLENYEGSVFLVHGLQGFEGPDPHTAISFNDALREAGIEVKEWYGQWNYTFPDRLCERSFPVWTTGSCRWDFAETLLHWFEYYLQDNPTVERGPWIQVQDNRGTWRNADSFPPRNVSWSELRLHSNGSLDGGSSPEHVELLAPPFEYGPPQPVTTPENAPRSLLELRTQALAHDTRISGLPQLEVTFEAAGPGGILAAWLLDESSSGKVLSRWYRSPLHGQWLPTSDPPVVGHAQIDLRFYDGGDEPHVLVPGQRSTARLQFEPLDVLLPRGHRLTLWLLQYPYPDHDVSGAPSPIRLVLGDASVLRLPMIQVDPSTVFPVPGVPLPSPEYFDWAHVRKPDYPELASGPPALEGKRWDCNGLRSWLTPAGCGPRSGG